MLLRPTAASFGGENPYRGWALEFINDAVGAYLSVTGIVWGLFVTHLYGLCGRRSELCREFFSTEAAAFHSAFVLSRAMDSEAGAAVQDLLKAYAASLIPRSSGEERGVRSPPASLTATTRPGHSPHHHFLKITPSLPLPGAADKVIVAASSYRRRLPTRQTWTLRRERDHLLRPATTTTSPQRTHTAIACSSGDDKGWLSEYRMSYGMSERQISEEDERRTAGVGDCRLLIADC